jgi:hypothetical protein
MTAKQIINFIRPLMLLVLSVSVFGDTDDTTKKQYQIKAAFLFNLCKTVTWPDTAFNKPADPYVIGILGEDPFGDSLIPIEGKEVKNRKIVIRRFKGFSQLPKDPSGGADLSGYDIESLKKCQILFICQSEIAFIKDILKQLENLPILTVSEVNQFLENGGMFKFPLPGEGSVFGINLIETDRVNLKISPKLIQIAKKIIKQEK